jgi:hypothetical protein
MRTDNPLYQQAFARVEALLKQHNIKMQDVPLDPARTDQAGHREGFTDKLLASENAGRRLVIRHCCASLAPLPHVSWFEVEVHFDADNPALCYRMGIAIRLSSRGEHIYWDTSENKDDPLWRIAPELPRAPFARGGPGRRIPFPNEGFGVDCPQALLVLEQMIAQFAAP